MGSPESEVGRSTTLEAQHEVTLTRAFTLSTAEISQATWTSVMGSNPSLFVACGDDCPVDRVSWLMAAELANALSDAAGLDACFTCDGVPCEPVGDPYDCNGYRLPTDAEWEYAVRGGTTAAFSNGANLVSLPSCDDATTVLDDVSTLEALAWHCANSAGTTHPSGEKLPNPLGLLDMHGNVYEWVYDWSAPFLGVDETDPVGPPTGALKVARGGCWEFEQTSTRSANRHAFPINGNGDLLGVLIARTLH